MKKLILLLIIPVLIYSSCKQSAGKKENQTTTSALGIKTHAAQLRLFTLNGISLNEADDMVSNFLQNKGSYTDSVPTSIWFSKGVFLQMYNNLVKNPQSDGIRFYFAQTVPNDKYTVVAVSTMDGGLDPKDSSKTRHIHNDYYQHDNGGMNMKGILGVVTPQEGALLYTPAASPSPCPSGSDPCPVAPHYITCSIAYKMVNYFGSDPINATSEWFDKGIINDLNNALTSQNGDGIRIYYARHLKPDGAAPSDTVHRHGVVLITTAAMPNNIHQDRFECISLHPLYGNKKRDSFVGGTDNGEECPTNCSGITWP
ncbi:MAG: hypothetical protein JWP45_2192 [Mucilaginibacter sp.]|nr:hypothetical protein [Mucilaginibacter sp.]